MGSAGSVLSSRRTAGAQIPIAARRCVFRSMPAISTFGSSSFIEVGFLDARVRVLALADEVLAKRSCGAGCCSSVRAVAMSILHCNMLLLVLL